MSSKLVLIQNMTELQQTDGSVTIYINKNNRKSIYTINLIVYTFFFFLTFTPLLCLEQSLAHIEHSINVFNTSS